MRPEAALDFTDPRGSKCGSSFSAGTLTPPSSSRFQDALRTEPKVRQPFKKPRVASSQNDLETLQQLPSPQKASSAPAADCGTQGDTTIQEAPADLWKACAWEEQHPVRIQKAAVARQPSVSSDQIPEMVEEDLWEQCEDELKADTGDKSSSWHDERLHVRDEDKHHHRLILQNDLQQIKHPVQQGSQQQHLHQGSKSHLIEIANAQQCQYARTGRDELQYAQCIMQVPGNASAVPADVPIKPPAFEQPVMFSQPETGPAVCQHMTQGVAITDPAAHVSQTRPQTVADITDPVACHQTTFVPPHCTWNEDERKHSLYDSEDEDIEDIQAEVLLRMKTEENEPGVEGDSEDELPLAVILSKASGSRAPPQGPSKKEPTRSQLRLKRQRPPLSSATPEFQPLPFHFSKVTSSSSSASSPAALPPKFASIGEYVQLLEQLLVVEMQASLHALFASAAVQGFCSAVGGAAATAWPPEVSVAVRGVLVGAAVEGPSRNFVLIFNQKAATIHGDLKACSRNDLWVVMLQGCSEPLLLRSLWRGVTPKGRLLCAAANVAASEWLKANPRKRLTHASAIASGAFSAEFFQHDALRRFAADLIAKQVSNKEAADNDVLALAQLLGAADPSPGGVEPTLDNATIEAVIQEVCNGFSDEQLAVLRHLALWANDANGGESKSGTVLVRGVFGSGKTRILAACVVLLDRILSRRKDPRRIVLICQTNVAVDSVLHQLVSQRQWDDFARLGSFRTVHPAFLYRTVSLMTTKQAAAKELSQALEKRPQEVREALREAVARGVLPPKAAVWRRRRLLAATAAALEAADFGSDTLHCPLVLIDEATQITEPAVFSCLQHVGARRVLLVGDPRQLPPRSSSPALQRSLLERLWEDQPTFPRFELLTQYRCHPAIAELSSRLFYGGYLRSGVSVDDRSSGLGSGAQPLAVVLSEGLEAKVGQSYCHQREAQLVAFWLSRAKSCSRLQVEDFGIICFYRPQAEACSRAASALGLASIEAATVDSFQGGEREAIALSCGRSSSATDVSPDNFSCCPRRLNVALSRARRHLVIFGTEAFLARHPIFSYVLAAARARGSVYSAAAVLG